MGATLSGSGGTSLSQGDTAFLLVSTALVQLMTPGLAFYYGGMVCDRSVISMMMQNFVSMGMTFMLWYFIAFSLSFGPSWGIVGDPFSYMMLRNVDSSTPLYRDGQVVSGTVPGTVLFLFQGMFAVITPAVMSGSFAGRFRFKAYLIFVALWLLVVYAPLCHWIWGGGFLAKWGVKDFAGGMEVHMNAGFSALASLMVVGNRHTFDGEEQQEPHNVPFVALGAALLWFGWFGFNCGSEMAIDSTAVAAAVNTQTAGAVSLFTWLMMDWWYYGRPRLVGACIGAVTGLVVITPAAGFVQPWAAFVMAVIASVVCYGCCEMRKSWGLDDTLDVWGSHGTGGFIGMVLLGALADPSECAPGVGIPAPNYCVNPNSVTRSFGQFGKQLVAAVFAALYSFTMTFLLLSAVNEVIPVVPPKEHLDEHLDLHEHGEQAYSPTVAYSDVGHSPTRAFMSRKSSYGSLP